MSRGAGAEGTLGRRRVGSRIVRDAALAGLGALVLVFFPPGLLEGVGALHRAHPLAFLSAAAVSLPAVGVQALLVCWIDRHEKEPMLLLAGCSLQGAAGELRRELRTGRRRRGDRSLRAARGEKFLVPDPSMAPARAVPLERYAPSRNRQEARMRVTPALLLFVAMVALAISLPGNAAPEGRSASPTEGPLDELGRRLFLGLQTGDSAVVRELLAEREDLDATLDVLEKRFADSPEMLEELAEGREEIEEMFGAERIAKFQAKREENVRTTLAARDWSAARLLGIEYEVELGDFGIREAEVDLVMEVAGSGVRVRADDLIETPHGWRSVEDRPLRVRVEED